ncbi:MAG: PQQ-binding-like beta-propeller repeat protein, partial [Candidatus Aminicenantaceae bacterium]
MISIMRLIHNLKGKIIIVFFLNLILIHCSIFQSPVSTYPEGIIFPVEIETRFNYEGEIIQNIKKRNDSLFFSTRNGTVFCINGKEQKLTWRFKAPEPLVSPVYLGSKEVYVYSESSLFCIDSEGELIWKKKVPEKITSGIGVNKDKVYLGTKEGKFYSLAALNGKEIWHFKARKGIRTTPVFWNNQIIFGCDDFCLYFVSEKGQIIDQLKVKGEIRSSPLIGEGDVYFGTNDHFFYCVDLKQRYVK